MTVSLEKENNPSIIHHTYAKWNYMCWASSLVHECLIKRTTHKILKLGCIGLHNDYNLLLFTTSLMPFNSVSRATLTEWVWQYFRFLFWYNIMILTTQKMWCVHFYYSQCITSIILACFRQTLREQWGRGDNSRCLQFILLARNDRRGMWRLIY